MLTCAPYSVSDVIDFVNDFSLWVYLDIYVIGCYTMGTNRLTYIIRITNVIPMLRLVLVVNYYCIVHTNHTNSLDQMSN